jgi:tetratricopeptide (TPR) repeat protein
VKRLWVVCLLLLCAAAAWGQAERKALAEQRWNEAVPLLLSTEKLHGGSAALYYNLGLCYQNLNDPGRARAYYAAALRRNPWHAGLHNNLALLKSKLAEPEPEETWLEAAAHCAPAEFLGSAMLLGSWGACALAWAYFRRPAERFVWAGLVCALIGVSATLLWALNLRQPAQAAILPETAALKNGPGGEYTDSIALHAGNLVDIVQTQGDWVEVDALDKVRAWVRRDELQLVP